MVTDMTAPARGGAAVSPSSTGYRWYVLALLFLANCFNAMDRSIVTIVVEPMKRELGLNDTQVGIITGLGYAIVYAGMGLAIARLVDRGNRKRTLAAGVAFWSTMTVLSGQAGSFLTMLAARFGIAAGESTCYPNSLSLIGDYFPRSKRSRAIAVFQLGTYAGLISGVAAAGVLSVRYGWRAPFGILGLPGLALATVIWLTLREPKRSGIDPGAAGAEPTAHSGLRAMLGLLAGNRSFALLVASSVIITIAQVTMGTWMPAFMMRLHGVGAQEVGLLAGPVIGLSGVVGTLVGGLLGTLIADRRPEERAPLQVMLYTAPLAVPSLLLFLFAPTLQLSLVGGALGAFMIAIHFGPLVAVILGAVGTSVRGTATSLLASSQFLIGLGLGPSIVGLVSDLLQPSLGAGSLRYAMLVAPITVALSWVLAVLGYRSLGGRIRAAAKA